MPSRPAPGPASDRRAGARRQTILHTLRQARGGLGIRGLAEQSGLHENTVRFHLQRLLGDGLVEREVGPATGPGRPRLTYRARVEDVGEPARDNHELMARILAGHLAGTAADPAAAAREAGEAWGRYQAPRPAPYQQTGREESVAELVRVLADIGFDPEQVEQPEATEIHLHHCPFLAVAQENQDVACSLHLGLMQGTLAELRAPVTAEHLEPFVRPDLCVARLDGTRPGPGA